MTVMGKRQDFGTMRVFQEYFRTHFQPPRQIQGESAAVDYRWICAKGAFVLLILTEAMMLDAWIDEAI